MAAVVVSGGGLSGANNLSAEERNNGEVHNVKTYGAKGDGATDDTTAIQSLLTRFSYLNTGGCESGVIYFPIGTYVISKTLYYAGSNGCSLRMYGGSEHSFGGKGSTILWKGSSGVPMLLMRGANGVEIDHLEFNTNGVATYGIYGFADNVYSGTFTEAVSPGVHTVTVSSTSNITAGTWLGVGSGKDFEIVQVSAVGAGTITADFALPHNSDTAFGGGPGSDHLIFEHDIVLKMSGADSVGLALGNPTSNATPQVGNVYSRDFYFAGDGTPIAGIKEFSSGNTKNLFISDSGFNGTQYGVVLTSANNIISDSVFSDIAVADVLGNGSITIIGCESEDKPGAVFVMNDDVVGDALTLIGNTWQAVPPVAGYVVTWGGNITLIDNWLGLSSANHPARVQDMGGTFSIFSEGNTFMNAPAGYAPFYDGSGNLLLPGRYTGTMPANVTSLEDNGGVPGSYINLKNTITVSSIISGSTTNAVASTGLVRAANEDSAVMFRNRANTADVNGLSIDVNNVVQVGGKRGIRLGTGGPTWTYGAGPPKGPCKAGSLYTSTDGTPSATLYVCEAARWKAH